MGARLAIAVLVAALGIPPVASASVTSSYRSTASTQGQLRVTSDGSDSIVVSCGAWFLPVTVNGAPPDTGPVQCWVVTAIAITGGPGDNRIDLSGFVNGRDFRGFGVVVGIDSGSGDDVIVGAHNALARFTGGAGDDRMEGQSDSIDQYEFGPAGAVERDTVVEPLTPRCEADYPGTNRPFSEAWSIPWDSLDFRSLSADDPVTADTAASGGTLASHRNRVVVSGTSGAGIGPEAIAGGAGDDHIAGVCMGVGGAGNDELTGSDTDGDLLLGGAGSDRLVGRSGEDTLNGAAGNDVVDAGPGPDTLVGGQGDDALAGGAGSDVYLFATADGRKTDTVAERRAPGIDVLSLDVETPAVIDLSTRGRIVARSRNLEVRTRPGGANFFEGAVGGRGADQLVGNGGRNHFWGGGGVDLASGRGGNDVYHVDWSASLPYGAYAWGQPWQGPFDRTQTGRPYPIPEEFSTLRVLETAGGGLDTLSFSEISPLSGGGDPPGHIRSGVRVDLGRRWFARTRWVSAVAARPNGARHLEGIRGTEHRDTLIGNAANNVLEGRQRRDVMLGRAGRDLCLTTTDLDFIGGCERIRRVAPNR
jgi:Ca2+-binding RTX toxin-like protein